MIRPLHGSPHSSHDKPTRPWPPPRPQGPMAMGCKRPQHPWAADLTLAEARERQRVAEGLHDQVGPLLTLANMRLAAIEASTERPMTEVRELVRQALVEIRSLTFELKDPLLETRGLAAALQDLGRRWQAQHGVECRVIAPDRPLGLSEAWSIFLLRATRELLWNIVKHADAQRAVVFLEHHSNAVELRVEDDGNGFDGLGEDDFENGDFENGSESRGFDTPQPPLCTTSEGGFGLPELQRRARQLGGQLRIAASPQGTRVQITAPIEVAEPAWPAAV